MRISVVATAICFSAIGLSVAADVEAAIKWPTNIPAQRLDQALQVFAKSRGLAMAYRSEIVSDLRTRGAVGELTASEALTQLLSGTGLTYLYLDDKTVTIVAVPVSGDAATDAAPIAAPAASSAVVEEKQTTKKGFFDRFRLAQVDETALPAEARRPTDTREERLELEEIVVTGSRLTQSSVKGPVPVSIYTREEIDRSGQTSVADFLSTLPRAFIRNPPCAE